jgi:HSP20 family protein
MLPHGTPAVASADYRSEWEDRTVIERYDPFGRMMSLRQMMDHLMEDAFIMPGQGRASGQPGETFAPAMNVYEEGDNLVVETEVPGMKPEDIDISIEHGLLTIRGQTRAEQERRGRNYIVREQRSGSFSRGVRLPETVDPDACQASYDNGVLRLVLSKSERARPRRIPITTAGQASLPASSQSSGSQAALAGATSSSPAGTGATEGGRRGGGRASSGQGGPTRRGSRRKSTSSGT